MKNKSVSLLVLIFALIAGVQASAQDDSGLLRQASMEVTILKATYKPQNGLPHFEVTEVCTKQSPINVYANTSIMYPEDLRLVECESELKGQKVNVSVGGAIRMYQDPQSGAELKNTGLLLNWGVGHMQTPQIVHASTTDQWHTYLAVISPVATGKIVDNVPQPPEPSEFFRAEIRIQD